jgi:hypothetical protein
MKLICKISGIIFSVPEFHNLILGERGEQIFHPVFSVPQKTLLAQTAQWAKGNFAGEENFLLFLALLNSSNLVKFRSTVRFTENSEQIVAQNYEILLKALVRLNSISAYEEKFPHVVISKDNQGLENIRGIITNWLDCHKAIREGYTSAADFRALNIRETALERMIKNPHKDIKHYGGQLAEWAAMAGNFPDFSVTIHGKTRILSEYWKELIKKCCTSKNVFDLEVRDLKELQEHCLDNIEMGSLYSQQLFKVLDSALERKQNYLGSGEIDISTAYQILDNPMTAEQISLQVSVMSAPEVEPKLEDYPSRFEYVRAKMRWQMKSTIEAKAKIEKKDSGTPWSNV